MFPNSGFLCLLKCPRRSRVPRLVRTAATTEPLPWAGVCLSPCRAADTLHIITAFDTKMCVAASCVGGAAWRSAKPAAKLQIPSPSVNTTALYAAQGGPSLAVPPSVCTAAITHTVIRKHAERRSLGPTRRKCAEGNAAGFSEGCKSPLPRGAVPAETHKQTRRRSRARGRRPLRWWLWWLRCQGRH